MGDYAFDEDNAELRKLNMEVVENPDEFENWEKLVRAAESLEGGLNRNSSPQSIAAARDVYDRFLAKFPLFFGYWKKYADLEFSIGGTEAAEMIYERGVASITISVDLWTNYCSFKVETSHDSEVIRELFERGANSVGLDFLAHPFWDKYLEFEERLEAHDKIFAILRRISTIPLHQYARYFERYRSMAATRPLTELIPNEVLQKLHAEAIKEIRQQGGSELDIDRYIRAQIDQRYLDAFAVTQTETTKRWTYEQEVKRPYFHVTELDEGQITNWQRYLDFEESEGNFERIAFLYERCLVTAAHYDEFWLRYARWMYAQEGKEEEVRNIFTRASCFYVPIAEPTIRTQWALFEETQGRPSVASAIYEAILLAMPGHMETMVALADLQRRQEGYEAAMAVYQHYLQASETPNQVRGAIVAEMAKLAQRVQNSADSGRAIFQSQQQAYMDSQAFWNSYLTFEIQQQTTIEAEAKQYTRIRVIHDDIRRKTRLPPDAIKELSQKYMTYLAQKGGKDIAKEYLDLDAEVNGPASIVPSMRVKNSLVSKSTKSVPTRPQSATTNGHAVKA